MYLLITDASAARWVRTGPVYGRDGGNRAAGEPGLGGRSRVVGVLARVHEHRRHAQAAFHGFMVAVQERLVGEVQPPGALLGKLDVVRAERTPRAQDIEHRPVGHAEDRGRPGVEPGDGVGRGPERLAPGRGALVEQSEVRLVDRLRRGAVRGIADQGPEASRGLYEDAVHRRSLVSSP